MEAYAEQGTNWIIPEMNRHLQQFVSGEVGSFWLGPKQIQVWLSNIRAEARRRLHDSLPRVPHVKSLYDTPDFSELVSDEALQDVLSRRWAEANLCFQAGAYLATVILLGSILEGVLLNKVEGDKARANTAPSAPRDKSGATKLFRDWTLENFINVSYECGWIKKQDKDFSHVVKDYRNYIHPNQERNEGITMDANICRIIWEVVTAALSST